MSDTVSIVPRVEMYFPTPDNFPGVTAWWRASDLAASYADGDQVGTWTDFVSGYQLVGNGSPNLPVFRSSVLNERPAVEFDGVATYFASSGFLFSNLVSAFGEGMIIAVVRVVNASQGIICQNSSLGAALNMAGSTPSARNSDAVGFVESFSKGNYEYVTTAALWAHTKTDLYVAAMPDIDNRGNNFDDSGLNLWTKPSGATTNLASAGVLVGTFPFALGSFLNGHVAEIITFNRLLTQSERRRIGAWLCTWYDIPYTGTVDATTPEAQWVDVSGDVVSDVKATWGIHGYAPGDRLAEPGALTFDVDDSLQNSKRVRGYYSPENPLARPGFDIGTPVRLKLVTPTQTKLKWQGTIETLRPVPGVADPKVSVSCVDWMDEAQRARIDGLPVLTNVQSDLLFSTLVSSMTKQPPNGTNIGSGSDIYPYALDSARDESSKIISELQKVTLSEFGIGHVDAGVLVWEGRKTRGGSGATRFALRDDDNLYALGVSHGRDDILNHVQVFVHPRRVDSAATTVLFTLGGTSAIARGTSVVMSCQYRDPSQISQRVGGKDMVTPVAVTDYLFNSLQDGTGTDLTSQLSVSYTPAVPGGNSAVVTVLNAGPFDGFLTKLQLRGRGLYDFEPILSDQQDAGSINSFGENAYPYDMPYQASVANGFDVALFILSLSKDARTRVTSATFFGNWGDAEADAALNLRVSDRISINVPSLGMFARRFFVNGFSYDVSMAGLVKVTLDLALASDAQFWTLDVPGRTELDLTTVLGFGLFTPGWILDTSALGTNTFLN